MKRFTKICVLLVLSTGMINCQSLRERTKRHSPENVISIERGTQVISLTYSRPYKNGRVIFGEKGEGALIPYGTKWRTGANEATEISLTKDVWIRGQKLQAGNYSLYTIPGEKSWIIAFNSRTGYWGASLGSPFKEKYDVLRVEVPVEKRSIVTEQFTIHFEDRRNSIAVVMSWDNIRVSVLME